MKKLTIIAVLIWTAFIISCNKTNQDITDIQTDERGSGLRPDKPEDVIKFPLQYSQEFMRNGRTISIVNGKTVLNLRATDANLQFRTESKPGRGNNNGGNTTTGGGGTTTTTGDITVPRVMILDPTAGRVYDLASTNWQRVGWTAIADDETKLSRIVVKIRGYVIKDTSGNIDADGTNGIWTLLQGVYDWPFGDGVYDMSVQAWDASGNTTMTSILFSRNTEMTPLPTNFPSSYIMSTPPKINQGGEGSCAAFAVATAYSIERYYRDNQTLWNNDNTYSPEWVYNIAVAGNGCGYGSGILSNIGIITRRGIPRWNMLPYSSQNGCDTSMFTDAIRADAALNKANYGYSVVTADINLIKIKIASNHPLVIGLQGDRNYINAGYDYIWTFPHYRDGGPHAMVIVGYDDKRHAFLCMNSWGPKWATNGCIWVDYDFMWQQVSGGGWGFNF